MIFCTLPVLKKNFITKEQLHNITQGVQGSGYI